MKVVHLTTVDLSLRFLVFAQLESVVALGGESVGVSAAGPWLADLEEIGVRHVALPASTRGIAPLADLRAAWQFWAAIRRERPDILHTHNPKPGIYGRILGRLAGIPIVINTVHGLYAAPDDPFVKRLIVYMLEAFAARFGDAELVQSREDLSLMRRLRLTRKGRARYLGNGVDLTRFDPSRDDLRPRAQLREELGIASDELVIGVVGRLVAEKGYPELFEAVSQLEGKYRLVVVGPDEPDKPDALPPSMIDAARASGVVFLGMRDDVDELYRAMDIFVLPSHREGFPRAAMEAASMGLPVIATDIRGCREVVDHGVNGLLVPVLAPHALREAIEELGDDVAQRTAMGKASREKSHLSFDEKKVVERVLAAYRDIAREKGLTDLAAALNPESGEVLLRPAEAADAPALARLHIEGIDTGFLPRLGRRFMTRLYEAMIGWPDASVIVADSGSGAIGFVAGVADTAEFYAHFYRHHGFGAAAVAVPALVRPAILRRAWETARYSDESGHAAAELLSMAVDPEFRRQGIAARLGKRFLDAMASRHVPAVKVVVGAGNTPAIAAYRQMGFNPAGATEVHPGEISEVLEWSQ